MNIMKIADKLYKVFVVAGSEPLGTAGIQADMKAIVACGGYAAGAPVGGVARAGWLPVLVGGLSGGTPISMDRSGRGHPDASQ